VSDLESAGDERSYDLVDHAADAVADLRLQHASQRLQLTAAPAAPAPSAAPAVAAPRVVARQLHDLVAIEVGADHGPVSGLAAAFHWLVVVVVGGGDVTADVDDDVISAAAARLVLEVPVTV